MISESRAAVLGALQAVGLHATAAGARIAPPCAIVEPGSPWIAPAGLGSRMREVTWYVHAITGRADQVASTAETDALAELVDQAFAGAPAAGLTGATFEQPGVMTLAGIDYLAVRATVKHRIPGG